MRNFYLSSFILKLLLLSISALCIQDLQSQTPHLISFSPQAMSKGGSITITGSNLTRVKDIYFGDKKSDTVRIYNDALLYASVPANPGSVVYAIDVDNNWVKDSLTGFVFLSSYAPKIVGLDVNTGTTGTVVNITGGNFNWIVSVSFGGTEAASSQIISVNQIRATVGAGSTGQVKVVTQDGADSIPGFTFIRRPVINSFIPAQTKTGDTIKIIGSNFTGTTGVSFGGVPAKTFVAVDDNLIKAVVGEGASGDVLVTNIAGSNSLAGISVIPTPTVTSFAPMVGDIGTEITVKGTNFTNANQVVIDHSKVPAFTILSDSVLKFTLDSSRSGLITVLSSLNAGVPSANPFAFEPHIEPAVLPSGDNPVSGPLTKKIIVDTAVQTYNGLPYVQRHYDVEPANNASTATATLTLYFLQEDFNNYNSYYTQGPLLPANPDDVSGKANLKIYQYHGFSATSVPGTYEEQGIEIDPDDNNIVWNYNTKLWEVTFNVTGFSGFFTGTNSAILPLKLLSFTATSTKDVTLSWTTTNEINVDRFEIQKSDDGRQFVTKGTVNANGAESQKTSYSFTDNNTIEGTLFYRLKMIDNDGRFSYSKVIKLTSFANTSGLVLYPNPTNGFIKISHPFVKNGITLKLVDVNGKVVKQLVVAKGTKETTMDVRNVSSGTYALIWSNGEQTFTKSVLIQ